MSNNQCTWNQHAIMSSEEEAACLDLQLNLQPAVDDSCPCPTDHELHLSTSASFQQQLNPSSPQTSESTLQTQPISLDTFLQQLRCSHFSLRKARTNSKLKLKMMRQRRGCAICQEWVKEKSVVYRLHCRHVFHRQCLQEWRCKSDSCPLCRQLLA